MPGALDQAKPFRAADLPPVYHQFRAMLRQRDPRGDREFVRILQLHREYPAAAVETALHQALQGSLLNVDGVRQILQQGAPRPAELATGTHGLPDIRMRQPALARYDAWRKEGGVH